MYDDDTVLESITPNIKSQMLYLLSKRGLLNNENVGKFAYDQLRKIDLSQSDVSDQGLFKLTRCKRLEKIDLNAEKVPRTSVSSAGISCLSRSCQLLQVVFLRRCTNITDEAIISLSENCPLLSELNIGGCSRITDCSLESLGKYSKKLSSVNFSRASVSDNGVFSLANGVCSKSLKEVHMNNCENLTDESVEAIVQFCPGISILIFHGCPLMTDQARMALEEVLTGRNGRMKQVTWTIY
ncbi:protein AMN1 homolog isoform X2 [Gigantopelta aegis]|nr:protein AMN1 homolog isoform X2 [Gigantopelta aegis]